MSEKKCGSEGKEEAPKCCLTWGGSYVFYIDRDFNWFQRKMIKLFFGLDYEKLEE